MTESILEGNLAESVTSLSTVKTLLKQSLNKVASAWVECPISPLLFSNGPVPLEPFRLWLMYLQKLPSLPSLMRSLSRCAIKSLMLLELEYWQLRCQFPTWQSPACSSSDRRNYESRASDQQMLRLTENKPSFVRKPHVVISRQSPFAAIVVPKLVAMATSLRPSVSAISLLDSLSPKTHPRIKQRVASYHTTEVTAHRKPKSGCHGNVPWTLDLGYVFIG